jgi:probable HAF family extracellular repeat protein
MDRSTLFQSRPRWVAAFMLALTACSAEPTRVVEAPDGALLAKGGGSGGGLAVTSTEPAFGERGTRLQVRVRGSGFDPTAEAAWERNGTVDPRVRVISTTFVSSTEVIADIEIGADADVDLYDVSVSIALIGGGRKKGVGIEMFEVTVAEYVPGVVSSGTASIARDINDAGQIVGGYARDHAYFWDPATGVEDLGTGHARGLSANGTIVVGGSPAGTAWFPKVWTKGPASWTGAFLSLSCLSNVAQGAAWAISPDGSQIGGRLVVAVSRKVERLYPVLWDGPAAECRLLSLPAGMTGDGYVLEVSGVGAAAGAVKSGGVTSAVVWDAAGVPTVLASLGGTHSEVRAFNSSGTIAAGISDSRAVFWLRTATGWSAPVALSATCTNTATWATAVNDVGVIVGKGCDGGRWWQIDGGVVVATEQMPGLGSSDPHPLADAITNNTFSGQPWAAGGNGSAVVWRVP